jgi:hypothetical protein
MANSSEAGVGGRRKEDERDGKRTRKVARRRREIQEFDWFVLWEEKCVS